MRRRAWFKAQPDLDPRNLIFIDETLASTKIARRRGRVRCEQQFRAPIPHGQWKTTTFTGALRLSGMTAPTVLDGPMNGAAFQAYVAQVLVPALFPSHVVVMDNLGAHKAQRSGPPLGEPARDCCTCRPALRTLTRSKTPFPSWRRRCAKPARARSHNCGT